MQFFNTVSASLLLAGSALAQTGSQVTVHVVAVSSSDKNTLTFAPNNLVAKPGEMVQFQFHNGNHSVTQSNFANPCIPINNVQSNVTGFFSGFQATPQGASSIPTYTVMVNDTKPIWYYCSQGKHCQAGMVGAINAPATGKTIEAFIAAAAQAPQNLAPGQSSSGSNNTTSTYTSGSSGSTSSSSPTSTGSSGSSGTTSGATTTSSGVTTASNAASAGFAGSQQVLTGGFMALLLSAILL